MTKKDFEVLAAVMRATYPEGVKDSHPEAKQWAFTVDELTSALARANPRFNSVRFLSACGVKCD